MGKLNLKSIRKIEIVEPSVIYDIYKGIVMDYYNELYRDYNNSKYEWFYKYYKKAYEELMSICNDFLNNKYELKIEFSKACEIYNRISKDFDGNLVFSNNDLTKEIVDFRINYINMKIDLVREVVFNKM